jgi:hypothetical protein
MVPSPAGNGAIARGRDAGGGVASSINGLDIELDAEAGDSSRT